MQTTGAALLTVRRCSPVRMRMLAQDSRSAYGLLYFAAAAPRGAVLYRPRSGQRWEEISLDLMADPRSER